MAEDNAFDFGDNVDLATFDQILEMDDEDEGSREFSHSIVFGFFEQATTTFQNMDDALDKKELKTLSNLGHYLKGSSATLGFTKVKVECEKIQHFGDGKDESGINDVDDKAKLLKWIGQSIDKAKQETKVCESLMRRYYAGLDGA